MTEVLTEAEHEAINMAGKLYTLIARDIVGDDVSAAVDLTEIAAHIHGIQRAVMAQAAGRSYPDRYRLLGTTIAQPWRP